MAPMMAEDAKTKVAAIDGIDDVTVNIVWDPPWTPNLIAESAKKKLGYA